MGKKLTTGIWLVALLAMVSLRCNCRDDDDFTIPTFALTTEVEPAGAGSIARDPDATIYIWGTDVQLTAVPNAACAFSHWSGDLSGTTNPETIEMKGPKSVTAHFLQIVTTSLPDGIAGINYAETLQAAGGTPPYTWNKTSGNLPDGLSLDSGTGVIDGSPTTPGTFGFTVELTDNNSVTASADLSITVKAAEADFSAAPLSGLCPLEVQFTDLSVGIITGWAWDFDGDTVVDSNVQNPTHTYNAEGTYTVSLTVTTAAGTDTETKTDYIMAVAIVADFTADPREGVCPLDVQFTDLSTGNGINKWEWDFDYNGSIDSMEQHPLYTYTTGGTYTVSLTATSPYGSDTEIKFDYIVVKEAPWPMYKHNRKHTGLSRHVGAQTNKIKWSFSTGWISNGSPAIDADEIIYIGDETGYLYAVNPNGSERWKFLTGGMIKSTPAIARDGTIYIGSCDHYLYAINPDGSQKWKFETGDPIDKGSPNIAEDGTIYIGSNDRYLYALNPNGTQKWKYDVGGTIRYSPAIAEDGTIYIGSVTAARLHAINPNGTGKWAYPVGSSCGSPAIGPDGTIYTTDWDWHLFAINPDGTEKWTSYLAEITKSSVVIGPDGTVYIGTYTSARGNFYAIDPDTGAEKWVFDGGGYAVTSTPAIGADGTIYLMVKSGSFHALNPDGTIKWTAPRGGYGSPAIGTDGTIYVGAGMALHAIGE